jgi:hypothetical protein
MKMWMLIYYTGRQIRHNACSYTTLLYLHYVKIVGEAAQDFLMLVIGVHWHSKGVVEQQCVSTMGTKGFHCCATITRSYRLPTPGGELWQTDVDGPIIYYSLTLEREEHLKNHCSLPGMFTWARAKCPPQLRVVGKSGTRYRQVEDENWTAQDVIFDLNG